MLHRRSCSIIPLLLAYAGLPGCFVVPIVQPAGVKELSLEGFPPDTEKVEVTTDDTTTLRGVFVPAGPGAPVILHLLPSQTSVTSGLGSQFGSLSLKDILRTFREKGYASLAIDYRGIGCSDGSRSPKHLPEDAWAMWQEALNRAGGQAHNVILRGTSLGTLPAASILERKATPRGAVLIAPIRAETIATHAPRKRKGAFLGTLISLFLRRPGDVDLVGVLEETPVPVLVLLPEADNYLPEDEMALVRKAAAKGGKRVLTLEGDHLQLVLKSHGYEFDGPLSAKASSELLEPEEGFLKEISRSRVP